MTGVQTCALPILGETRNVWYAQGTAERKQDKKGTATSSNNMVAGAHHVQYMAIKSNGATVTQHPTCRLQLT